MAENEELEFDEEEIEIPDVLEELLVLPSTMPKNV